MLVNILLARKYNALLDILLTGVYRIRRWVSAVSFGKRRGIGEAGASCTGGSLYIICVIGHNKSDGG